MNRFRLHGANPEKLYAAFGLPRPAKIYDFSTNTNAVKWHGSLDFDRSHLFADYPDDDSEQLRGLIAEQNGCRADNVLVTNGSNEAIFLAASCQSGRLSCLLQPVYGEYARALAAFGAEARNIFALSEIPRQCASVWLCNPCNPTGGFIGGRELEAEAARRPQTLFVVDEAYLPFMYEQPQPLDFAAHGNLLLLRSLTKIYHLCGARIGYVLAAPAVIETLRRRQPTWSVNSFAQQAAAAYLRDPAFAAATREYYRRETPRLMDGLRRAGFSVLPTCVNFFLLETDDDESLMVFLLKRGIVVRHTRNFPGLDGRCVRIAVRTPEEDDLLMEAMKEYQATRPRALPHQ